jgi:hypothetical protein
MVNVPKRCKTLHSAGRDPSNFKEINDPAAIEVNHPREFRHPLHERPSERFAVRAAAVPCTLTGGRAG